MEQLEGKGHLFPGFDSVSPQAWIHKGVFSASKAKVSNESVLYVETL